MGGERLTACATSNYKVYYSSSTQRLSLNKCASEERNIEEVSHKIKLSNHSATRLVRFWQKPNQGHCLQSVAIETTHSCQTGTFKPAGRVIRASFVMTCSPLTPQPPVTIQTARPPFQLATWESDGQRSTLAGSTIAH